MKSVFRAVFVSLAIHLLIALGFVLYLDYGVRATTSVTLDLSALDLSVAEEDVETAEARPEMPSVAEPRHDPPRPLPPPVPETEMPSMPPEPDEYMLPEPPPERPEMPEERPEAPPAAATERSAPRQAKIDAPPQPVRNIRPDYPRLAKLRGEEGDVVVEIQVGADGSVAQVAVVSSSGFPSLDEAAVKAARSARFKPAKAEGRPVASAARLTLEFRLK